MSTQPKLAQILNPDNSRSFAPPLADLAPGTYLTGVEIVDGEPVASGVTLPGNQPGGPPIINDEGVVPARVSVLVLTTDELSTFVPDDGEIVKEVDGNGNLIGLRIGDGVTAGGNPVGERWEVETNQTQQLFNQPVSDVTIFETPRDSVVTGMHNGVPDVLLMEVEFVVHLSISGPSGSYLALEAPGVEFFVSKIDGSETFGPFPGDGEWHNTTGAWACYVYGRGVTLVQPSGFIRMRADREGGTIRRVRYWVKKRK